jgi:RNA polymerase sigma-54 factor
LAFRFELNLIKHLHLEGTPTEKIVTEHLRLLHNHQMPELARKLGLTIEELKTHVEIIQHLDPKPGSRFNPQPSQYVIPDVYIIKVEDQYVAVLNEDGLPQLRISPTYRRLLDKGAAENSDETRAYVKDKFRSALWLIKSVEQRQKTIHKVATSICNFQRDFLDHGIEHLRPLVLRDVANDIGMHESTASQRRHEQRTKPPQGVTRDEAISSTAASAAPTATRTVRRRTDQNRIKKIIGEDPKAAQRLQDRQHPATGRPDAGPAHDCEVPRRAEDSDVEPKKSSVLACPASGGAE